MDAFTQIFNQLDRELWLITAKAGDRASGLIATYVANVSLVPTLPRVTIALANHHFTRELIEASGAFCMHLIDERHVDWVWRFGLPSGRDVDKLSGLATSISAGGSPILTEAPAWVDCRVEDRLDTGDRTIFLAEVLDAHLAPSQTRPQSFLTFKRLLEISPADKLRELKQGLDRDIEIDRAAILDWRRRAAER